MVIGSVLGAVAGAAAGVLFLIVTGAGGSSDGTGLAIIFSLPILGAGLGFLLGLAIPLLWRALGPRVLGTLAGAGAGVVLGIIVFDNFAAVIVGFLLGLAIPLIWHGWKLLTTTRQSCEGPVEHSAEAGPLREGGAPSNPRG